MIDWGFSLAVVITGLVVVFAVLVILVLLCSIMGSVFKSMNSKKDSKPEAPKPEKKAEISRTAAPMKAAAPVVEAGIPGEVVAAISAAVSCMMGSNQAFAVRKISRAKGGRPAWNAAGIAENTHPF